MPRRKRAEERPVVPDPKYNSELVTTFINCLMKDGKKSTAERIFYNAMDLIAEKTNSDAMVVFDRAMKNVKPMLEVRPRRVGGATYQVPMEVRPKRKVSLAIRWMLAAARARPEHTMQERLANEVISASNREGAAIKKREDTHRMAEANRAFAHFRW
ncbi:30S ribosomal protein S7 [candidate division TA06 bacterium DG_26]|uniref:Small ribosomal subunit protein uS7 n=1 Tax=candidate division TA06 bacterium DG_26 TaxID=1703771 RepID=A0A0S7WMF7_UNCT6|nr:MAG: 30S ribosomal protein S7 [candidate division TA06 bacterium DG_26]